MTTEERTGEKLPKDIRERWAALTVAARDAGRAFEQLAAAGRTAALLLHSVAEHAPAWTAGGSDYRVDAAVFRAAALDLDRLAPPEGTSE